jgi:GNAT superfamily N-acetyltransferase
MILDAPAAGTVFVARDGPAVVGTVSLHYTISTAEGDRVAWVEDVVVRPDRRGGGLGSRLIRHAIDFAQTANIPRLTLLTDGVNADAIRFYTRHGFRRSDMVTLRLFPKAVTATGAADAGPR